MKAALYPEELRLAACSLAEEIRDGRWSHLRELASKPAPAISELIEELRKRCSGFPIETYQRALADGLFETR
jgi:hypothetical protein